MKIFSLNFAIINPKTPKPQENEKLSLFNRIESEYKMDVCALGQDNQMKCLMT